MIRRSLLAVPAALLLALTACSNDSETPDATEAPTTTAAPESTDAPEVTEAPMTTDAPVDSAAPATEAPTSEAPTTEAPALGSIIDVATAAGNFTTLLQAVEAAGLTEELATGNYTVLAPTDEAFAALDPATLDALLADPAQLTAVLRNHLLPAVQDAELVGIMSNLLTVDGASLVVTNDGGTITIGGATVVQADVMADNGVIHAIDTVLVPAAG